MSTEAHPLFPAPDEDEDPPCVRSIHVMRDGKTFPRRFAPHELTDLEQIAAAWGGGHYTLIARDERQITAKVDLTLAGAPRPFVPDDEAMPGAPSAAPAALPAPSSGSDLMAILTFVANQQQQSTQVFAQMMQANQQMLVAMLGRQQEQQLQHDREMAQLHERSAAREAQMFAAVLQGTQNRADPQAAFLQGVAVARNLLGGGDDGTDEETDGLQDIVSAAGNILQGVQTFTGGNGQAPPGQQPPAQPAPTEAQQ